MGNSNNRLLSRNKIPASLITKKTSNKKKCKHEKTHEIQRLNHNMSKNDPTLLTSMHCGDEISTYEENDCSSSISSSSSANNSSDEELFDYHKHNWLSSSDDSDDDDVEKDDDDDDDKHGNHHKICNNENALNQGDDKRKKSNQRTSMAEDIIAKERVTYRDIGLIERNLDPNTAQEAAEHTYTALVKIENEEKWKSLMPSLKRRAKGIADRFHCNVLFSDHPQTYGVNTVFTMCISGPSDMAVLRALRFFPPSVTNLLITARGSSTNEVENRQFITCQSESRTNKSK